MTHVIHVPENVRAIAEAVVKEGGVSYMVGGCVRDSIVGVTPKDYDMLVCNVQPGMLGMAMAGVKGVKYVDFVGQSFGVFKVSFENEVIDVAIPRKYTAGVSRDAETDYDPFLPVEEDLARRDFTMNAIAYNLNAGVFHDPFFGRHAIAEKMVKAVGNADERFAEDPLRILRALRFASKLGFQIAATTFTSIRQNQKALEQVSQERIGEEFLKLLAGAGSHKMLVTMSKTGLLETIIPEWKESIGFEQNNPHHYATVDKHVLDAYKYVAEHNGSLRARLAVLLHDIAKPRTYSEKNGIGHFYSHEFEGYKLSAEIMRRLRIPEEMVKSVSTIIREHLRPPKEPSEKALRKYMADLGSLWEDALMVKAGDVSAHVLPEGFDTWVWHQDWDARLRAIPAFLSGFDQKKLALSGGEVVKTFGVQGTEVGRFKNYAAAAVVEGKVANDAAAILSFLQAEKAEGRL